MGAYKYIKKNFQASYKQRSEGLKSRLIGWRNGPTMVRLEHPSNVARARELGFKAKQGVVVVRVRVKRGRRKREKNRGGRKPSKSGRFFSYKKSFQSVAEERAARKYKNCEALNSYYVGDDGVFKFFEVILIDRTHAAVSSDKQYAQIIASKGRAFRGLTSSGRKHRGLGVNGPSVNTMKPQV